jgi:ankyrin repeat protein
MTTPRLMPPLGVVRVLRPFHEHSLEWCRVDPSYAPYTTCKQCDKADHLQVFKCAGCGFNACAACTAVTADDVAAEAALRVGPDAAAAAAAGDAKKLRAMLAAGAKADDAGADKATLLHKAAKADSGAACVQVLLDAGADASAKDLSGSTPLHVAARANAAAVAKALLAKGADIDAVDDDGSTALHVAAQQNCADVVNVLLNAGGCCGPSAPKPALNVKDNRGYTALYYATSYLNPRGYAGELKGDEVALALLAAGADAKEPSAADESTLLLTAAESNKHRVVKALLAAGANVNEKRSTTSGFTPLLSAAGNDDTASTKLLLDAGADIEARSADETFWPLMMAASNAGATANIPLLVSRGAKLDAYGGRDGGNYTVLLAAVAGSYADNVAALLKAGADRAAKTKDGRSLEELVSGDDEATKAALAGTLPAFRAAEAKKAADEAAAAAKSDPLAYATEVVGKVASGDLKPLQAALKDKSLDPNLRTDPSPTSMTILGLCIMQAHGSAPFVDAVRLLLQHGADPLLKFDVPGAGMGVSALQWCVRYPEPYWAASSNTFAADVIKLLLDKGVPVDTKDDTGVTPLAFLGAMAPCPAVLAAMRVLVERGADVQAKAADDVSVVDGAFGDLKQMLIELKKI